MKLRTLLAMLLLLLATRESMLAYSPRMFVEGNASVNVPTGAFGSKDFSRNSGGADTGFGYGLSAGLTGNIVDVYIGYRTSSHNASGSTFLVDAQGSWTINQWMLGTRVHIKRTSRLRLSPLFGLAVVTNRATADGSGVVLGQSGSISLKHDVSLMVEAGAVAHLSPRVDLLGALQFHNFYTEFDHPLWQGTIHVTYTSVTAGIAYLF
jgi:hypothetical protein